MSFRSRKQLKSEFVDSRVGQSDEDFLAGCGLPIEAAKDALGVRTAIANLAGVSAEDIHAGDAFDGELSKFDLWRSLDSIALVLELEKCLGIEIDDGKASQIHNPESKPRTAVAEFVRRVLQVVYGGVR